MIYHLTARLLIEKNIVSDSQIIKLQSTKNLAYKSI